VLDVNAEEVQTEDGAEEAGERLLRASQGVELIAAQLSSKSPYLRWVRLLVVRMQGIDQSIGVCSRAY
jgi:hypothetical protein